MLTKHLPSCRSTVANDGPRPWFRMSLFPMLPGPWNFFHVIPISKISASIKQVRHIMTTVTPGVDQAVLYATKRANIHLVV